MSKKKSFTFLNNSHHSVLFVKNPRIFFPFFIPPPPLFQPQEEDLYYLEICISLFDIVFIL